MPLPSCQCRSPPWAKVRARVGQGMGGLGREVEGSRPGEARPGDAAGTRYDRNRSALARLLGEAPPRSLAGQEVMSMPVP